MLKQAILFRLAKHGGSVVDGVVQAMPEANFYAMLEDLLSIQASVSRKPPSAGDQRAIDEANWSKDGTMWGR